MKRDFSPVLRHLSLISKGLSIALILVFTLVNMIQAIHAHEGPAITLKDHSHASLQTSTSQCPICCYFLQKDSQVTTPMTNYDLELFSVGVNLPAIHPISNAQASMALGWTNKGPPRFC